MPGTRRGRVVILGGGVVGRNAATIAIGMGAQVTVLDVRADTMAYLEDVFGGSIETLYSNPTNIEQAVERADLVVGAVLVTGAVAPKLVTEDLIGRMEKGSVVVDVAVDQGGCIETCRPTSHDHPTYEVKGVVHYCVPNMPGAVAQTSTWALTNTTMAYAVKLAEPGLVAAAKADPRSPRGSTPTAVTSPTSRSPRRTSWSTFRPPSCSASGAEKSQTRAPATLKRVSSRLRMRVICG